MIIFTILLIIFLVINIVLNIKLKQLLNHEKDLLKQQNYVYDEYKAKTKDEAEILNTLIQNKEGEIIDLKKQITNYKRKVTNLEKKINNRKEK